MWTAPAHSTQQKQSHLALPNGRDGLLCLLTGNGAPSVCRMNKLWKNWAIWEWSMKRGAENRQPNWILFWWVWIGGPAPRQLAKREDKRAAPTNQFKSNQLPLAPQEKESWWMNCLGLEWSWVVWVWVCFLLWINGAGTAQCSAKEETSQTKQTQTEWKPAEPINHQLNKKRVALAALELFNWWVMGRSPSTAHQQQPKKENFLLLLCCLLWVCLH